MADPFREIGGEHPSFHAGEAWDRSVDFGDGRGPVIWDGAEFVQTDPPAPVETPPAIETDAERAVDEAKAAAAAAESAVAEAEKAAGEAS